ncbi:MAG: hypothetical protein V3T17_04780 [Pseudomonadales bacterium]
MCSHVIHTVIHEANRSIIAVLSLLGFFWDGYQVTDVFFAASLLLWIWQHEWDELEARVVDWVARADGASPDEAYQSRKH